MQRTLHRTAALVAALMVVGALSAGLAAGSAAAASRSAGAADKTVSCANVTASTIQHALGFAVGRPKVTTIDGTDPSAPGSSTTCKYGGPHTLTIEFEGGYSKTGFNDFKKATGTQYKPVNGLGSGATQLTLLAGTPYETVALVVWDGPYDLSITTVGVPLAAVEMLAKAVIPLL